jgi:ferritin
MTEEEKYINKFLIKNYLVKTTSSSFAVLDKNTKQEYPLSYFKKEMAHIMMETSWPTIDIWFTKHSNELIKDLDEHIRGIDYSKYPTLFILDNIVKHFKPKKKYDEGFIKSVFYNYHKQHNIVPKLDELTKNIQNSNQIMDVMGQQMEFEPTIIRDFVLDYLNEWYSTSILGQKITDFFRQFVVTLGPTNWKVTWIGHGEVTQAMIRQEFRDESEYQLKIVFNKYHKWYEEEIIQASERMLKIS